MVREMQWSRCPAGPSNATSRSGAGISRMILCVGACGKGDCFTPPICKALTSAHHNRRITRDGVRESDISSAEMKSYFSFDVQILSKSLSLAKSNLGSCWQGSGKCRTQCSTPEAQEETEGEHDAWPGNELARLVSQGPISPRRWRAQQEEALNLPFELRLVFIKFLLGILTPFPS